MSLELAAGHSLKRYASLKLYFLSEGAPTNGAKYEFGGLKRFEILKKAFEDTMKKVYLYMFIRIYSLIPNKITRSFNMVLLGGINISNRYIIKIY